MTILLYDLAGRDGRRFSPNCWRVRMALAHKNLPVETRPVRFADIAGIGGGGQRSVPVIDDGGRLIADSMAIADHLEAAYPEPPSLFAGEGGRNLTTFVQAWSAHVLNKALFPMIVYDIFDHLAPEDQAYFRASREARLGRSLEAAQAGRDASLPELRAALAPLRDLLRTRAFLGGAAPLFADYVVFGSFQWARTISPFRLLEAEDPVAAWVERCLDLHDGLARRAPAYWP